MIHTIDLNYLGVPESVAAFLVEAPGGPVLIETGPTSTLDALGEGLEALGVAPRDIRHVLVTHIHLDHAGAAGWWAGQGARIYVHAFGARHLVDPTKLLRSARRIFGDKLERLWGDVLAAPADLVIPIADGDIIDVNGIAIRAIETPGHARHHHAFALEIDDRRVCFTGDAAAMFVPRTGHLVLPTPPPEFDLEAWLASVERLEAQRFDVLHLTHFGAIDDPSSFLHALSRTLMSHATLIRDLMRDGLDRDEIARRYQASVRDDGRAAGLTPQEIGHFLSDNLLSMSVDGMMRYFQKSGVRLAGVAR